MKGRTTRGTISGESRHIPNSPKILGCLKDFILIHSSMKFFRLLSECISETINDIGKCTNLYVTEVPYMLLKLMAQ